MALKVTAGYIPAPTVCLILIKQQKTKRKSLTALHRSSFVALTLRGRLYRRRYQLVFFKTSAKDIKNTPSILVVQISVIHQLKL